MKTRWIILCALPVLALSTQAAPETFDFKDPKKGNKIEFKLDAPEEKIAGAASDISGSVVFDPENPGATHGKIIVATASLVVPNQMQANIMRGPKWLDAAANPEITFETKELKNVKTDGNTTTADAIGIFSLHGVAKEVTIPVEIKYLKDKLAERLGGDQKGDILVINSSAFAIKRSDYNIQSGKSENKVADTISLTIGVAGASPK